MNDDTDDRIDQQLRDAFSPPPKAHYREVAQGVSRPVRPMWPWVLAAAAALLVAVLWLDDRRGANQHGGGPVGPEGHGAAQLAALWTAAYDHAIDQGFGVGGCCEGAADIAERCREICGQSLSFGGDDDVQLLGCYCGLPTGGSVGLLLQVHGDPVAVFVLPQAKDPVPDLRAREDLVLNRRELGDLSLYAIGFEDRSEALRRFSL